MRKKILLTGLVAIGLIGVAVGKEFSDNGYVEYQIRENSIGLVTFDRSQRNMFSPREGIGRNFIVFRKERCTLRPNEIQTSRVLEYRTLAITPELPYVGNGFGWFLTDWGCSPERH